MAEPPTDLPLILFPDADAWEAWLEEHHASATGVWMRIAKKAAALESATYAEALEIALCFGWIDGLRRSLDAESFVQRFTPRRSGSVWSQINRDKAEELIERGLMRPAGLAAVEAARANGRWDTAYGPARTATVPPDLQAELDLRPEARAFFETLTGSNRFAILYRIQTAKRPETRARRIAQFVAMLERREKIYG